MDWKERLRKRLRKSRIWALLMFLGSLMNIAFAWPTVWNAWHTEQLGALSIVSSWMLLYIQIVFSTNGWIQKDKFLSYSGVGAAMSTAAILIRLYSVRYHWF